METIIATAFGRVIDIQGGENDELTNAASNIFQRATNPRARYFFPLARKFCCYYDFVVLLMHYT